MQHELTEQQRAKLAGRKVVASISGGKDSAALSLWLTENGIEHLRVFQDTGWESQVTYDYLRGELTNKIGPITEIRAPLQMRDLILKKGMFPSRQRRYCTEELKIKPFKRFRETVLADTDCVNAVGIRRDESKARADSPEWEWSNLFDCEVWRPLVDWTWQDVIDIHTRHNLKPNPLYLRGAERVGCWPCINSRKSEIAFLAENDAARIVELAELEQLAAIRADERQAKLKNPTFFQSTLPDENGKYPCIPIHQVVDWARTTRGGKQYEMFAGHARDQGCVRWGLCEQPRLDADK